MAALHPEIRRFSALILESVEAPFLKKPPQIVQNCPKSSRIFKKAQQKIKIKINNRKSVNKNVKLSLSHGCMGGFLQDFVRLRKFFSLFDRQPWLPMAGPCWQWHVLRKHFESFVAFGHGPGRLARPTVQVDFPWLFSNTANHVRLLANSAD